MIVAIIMVMLAVLLVSLVTMVSFIDYQTDIEYKLAKSLSIYNGGGVLFMILTYYLSPTLAGINSYFAGMLLMHFMVLTLRK